MGIYKLGTLIKVFHDDENTPGFWKLGGIEKKDWRRIPGYELAELKEVKL